MEREYVSTPWHEISFWIAIESLAGWWDMYPKYQSTQPNYLSRWTPPSNTDCPQNFGYPYTLPLIAEVIYVPPLPELWGRDEAEGARLPRPAERRRERLLRAARGISRELTLRSKVLLEPNMSHKLNLKSLYRNATHKSVPSGRSGPNGQTAPRRAGAVTAPRWGTLTWCHYNVTDTNSLYLPTDFQSACIEIKELKWRSSLLIQKIQ